MFFLLEGRFGKGKLEEENHDSGLNKKGKSPEILAVSCEVSFFTMYDSQIVERAEIAEDTTKYCY